MPYDVPSSRRQTANFTDRSWTEDGEIKSNEFSLDEVFAGNGSKVTPAQLVVNVGLFDRYVDQIPLVGYPGPMFTAIHALALLCLAASVLVSFGLIVFRCCSNKMRCGRSSARRVTGELQSDSCDTCGNKSAEIIG